MTFCDDSGSIVFHDSVNDNENVGSQAQHPLTDVSFIILIYINVLITLRFHIILCSGG